MQKEIGGYFGLEELAGREFYPGLYKVNLGRTALLWLLESRKCTRLWLPYFLCDSVTQSCRGAGIELCFYYLNEDLSPRLPEDLSLGASEYLYLVSYYGQLTDALILDYQKRYCNIIVDHTQAFFQPPLPGVDTLYSCRKYFGVSDGAYLSTDAPLTPNKPKDFSYDRMGHILGRYEVDAGTFYRQMLDNADQYHSMEIRTMSALTENLLKAIDYEAAAARRKENYLTLQKLLPSDNVFTRTLPEGPFCYPWYHPDGPALRKKLAQKKIFVPTYWSNVLAEMPEDTLEYQWAANILPLPCDQRYTAEEMHYIAKAVKQELL